MMHRNLDRRVEVLVRLGSAKHTRELSDLIDLAFDPGTSSWHLGADGEWQRVDRAPTARRSSTSSRRSSRASRAG